MNPLFANFTKSSKAKLLKTMEASSFTFPKNTDLSSMVLDPSILGIIESGSIQIIKNDYDGNPIIIDNLVENDMFGAVLFPITHEYSIVTREEAQVTFIDYSRLMENGDSYTTTHYLFIQNLLRLVLDKVQEKNDRIEILTQKTIRDKLLAYFQMLFKKSGSRILYLPFTFTELAFYLAVDRSAMSREMKYLKEEGFIRVSQRKITLLYDIYKN